MNETSPSIVPMSCEFRPSIVVESESDACSPNAVVIELERVAGVGWRYDTIDHGQKVLEYDVQASQCEVTILVHVLYALRCLLRVRITLCSCEIFVSPHVETLESLDNESLIVWPSRSWPLGVPFPPVRSKVERRSDPEAR